MSRIRMTALTGLAAALFATAAYSETFTEHFMGNWDLNSDGSVTLSEVTERRESVFAAFDANDDGYIDAEERAAMDEMRNAEHASMEGEGMERPHGGQGMAMGEGHSRGKGFGPGKGMGEGHGMGRGMKMGEGHGGGMQGGFRMNAEAGMHDGRMIDTDGDGRLSRDEFVGMSQTWLARLDVDGDGKITQGDF